MNKRNHTGINRVFAPLVIKEYFLLFIIVCIAAFLRLYRLTYMVGFDFDQEYAAQFAHTIINVFPIQLIGQGLSVQGLFMGPLYFYYLVPFFYVTHLDPIGGYIGSIFLGLVTILVYYFIGKHVFNYKIGLLLAFFRAILFAAIQADWSMAPSYSSELAILLTWYCLYNFWQGRKIALLGIGFVAGMYTSFHPILFPLYLVILLVLILKWKNITIKYLALTVTLFIIPMSPLILFEYFHRYLEVRVLFSLSHSTRAEVKDGSTFIEYAKLLFYFPYTYLNLPDSSTWRNILSIVSFIAIIFAAVKKIGFWRNIFHRIIVISTPLIVLLYYFYLPVHAPDYYFLAGQILYFLYFLATLGLLLNSRTWPFIVFVIIFLVFWLNIKSQSTLWQHSQATLGNKEDVIKQIYRREGNNQYNVVYNMGPGQQYGYGYLFRYYANLYRIQLNSNSVVHTYIITFPAENAKRKLIYRSGDIGLTVQ